MRREADKQSGCSAALPVELDRRTGHGSEGTEDTAIPGTRLQQRLATRALVEEDARIRRHCLDRRMATLWTVEMGFELHGPSCRLTSSRPQLVRRRLAQYTPFAKWDRSQQPEIVGLLPFASYATNIMRLPHVVRRITCGDAGCVGGAVRVRDDRMGSGRRGGLGRGRGCRSLSCGHLCGRAGIEWFGYRSRTRRQARRVSCPQSREIELVLDVSRASARVSAERGLHDHGRLCLRAR